LSFLGKIRMVFFAYVVIFCSVIGFLVWKTSRPKGSSGFAELVTLARIAPCTTTSAKATGFFVSPTDVVTVAHILLSSDKRGSIVRVHMSKSDGFGVVRSVDRSRDLALVSVLPQLGLAVDNPIRWLNPRIGMRTDGVTWNGDRRVVHTPHVILRVRPAVGPSVGSLPIARDSFEFDGEVQPGDSGAPIVLYPKGSQAGGVVGMIFSATSHRDGVADDGDGGGGFAIAAKELSGFVATSQPVEISRKVC
jgi:hypothetical protein